MIGDNTQQDKPVKIDVGYSEPFGHMAQMIRGIAAVSAPMLSSQFSRDNMTAFEWYAGMKQLKLLAHDVEWYAGTLLEEIEQAIGKIPEDNRETSA